MENFLQAITSRICADFVFDVNVLSEICCDLDYVCSLSISMTADERRELVGRFEY